MRVRVDPDLCGGHGDCTLLAPQIFDIDDEGVSVVLVADPSPDLHEAAAAAAAACPNQAILIED